MGVQQSQSELFSYSVNLDKRVRADHPLREVAAVLDLSRVHKQVAHCYGCNGNSIIETSPEMAKALRVAYQEQERKQEEMNPQAVNAIHVSTTDPQATLGDSYGPSVPLS